MNPILAHFGHWYVELFYFVPVVFIVGALKLQAWREKRREKEPPPTTPHHE